jgi:hypothetical protein
VGGHDDRDDGTIRLLIYGTIVRRSGQASALAAGYLLVWILFSLGATAFQRLLTTLVLLSPMMEVTSPAAGAGLLVIAGLHQFPSLVCKLPPFVVPNCNKVEACPKGVFSYHNSDVKCCRNPGAHIEVDRMHLIRRGKDIQGGARAVELESPAGNAA